MKKDKKNIEQPIMVAVMPDPKVFGHTYADSSSPDRPEHGNSFWFDHDDYPESGGIFQYFKGTIYPRPCFPFDDAIHATNQVKRNFLGYLRLFSKNKVMALSLVFSRKARIEAIRTFVEAADSTLNQFYYNAEYPRYYCAFAKQVGNFVEYFMLSLHIGGNLSFRFARIMMMFFEHDNAYRLRAQDLARITSQQALIKNFPKEFKMLLDAFSEREPNTKQIVVEHGNFEGNYGKMYSVYVLFKVFWIFPKFRRAVRRGLEAMDWENVLPTPADIYFAYWNRDYDSDGLSAKERLAQFAKWHEEAKLPPPPQIVW